MFLFIEAAMLDIYVWRKKDFCMPQRNRADELWNKLCGGRCYVNWIETLTLCSSDG